ncbi:MAG: class II D-tagatose-bisphosphate aldolase, non-catalytic subunit [Candidatus Sulfotelmatobacter sp.]
MTVRLGARAVANSTERVRAILENNRRGKTLGVYSICSANRFVLEAGMLQARRDGTLLLIESTSNQVNQFGGYTGQTPTQFVDFVKEIAASMNFPAESIVFGGDHLGPHVWRMEPCSAAMQKAEELVHTCVLAGYTKIHLDASMQLADDPGDRGRPLAGEIISNRAAELCRAAEEAHAKLPQDWPAPLYVIGTEVPTPGGEVLDAQAPKVTRIEDLSQTIDLAHSAFSRGGLEATWERVVAVVVQPGVEFGDDVVFPYLPENTRRLSRFAHKQWHGVYEAHSTDYQERVALRQMVRDHFAILKVGPWLTFAFREAVFALSAVEQEWLGSRKGIVLSGVRESLEEAMLANPEHWSGYYRGDDAALRLARKYSLSDRCRYYWPQAGVVVALQRLLANLTSHPAPIALLSQYLPNQSAAVRAKVIANQPVELILNRICEVIDHYAFACGIV